VITSNQVLLWKLLACLGRLFEVQPPVLIVEKMA
jgi:hypothetical protein